MPKQSHIENYEELKSILGNCENTQTILFESSPDTIIILNKKLNVVYSNLNAAALFHKPPVDLKGKKFSDFLANESKNDFEELYSTPTNEVFSGRRQIVRLGEWIVDVETKETPIYNSQKKFTGIILHLRDISDLRRSEELLNLRSQALEAMAIGIAITNNRGDIVWVNSAFTDLTGYSEDELLYKNMRILNSGKQDKKFYTNLWDQILAGNIWQGELYNKRKDGRYYSEEQTITPVKDKKNNISHFIVSKINISKRKKMEEDLRQMNEELEQLVKKRTDQLAESEKMASLGQLVAGVAHEINNPLGISYTAATYLKDQSEMLYAHYNQNELKKSDLEKYLNNIAQITFSLESNLTHAADLIRNFKQLAVDQSTEKERTFYIKKYFEETITSLKPQLARTKHKVSVNCPDNLQITSYPGVYSQIITNLVLNSLIHGFENIEEGIITLDVNVVDENLYFSYFDNGNGIPKKHIKKIFDPFFSTKFGQGGSGLGLNIIYNLVRRKLKGEISCISESDKGVHFKIIAPLNKDVKRSNT